MNASTAALPVPSPVVTRLSRLASLERVDVEALQRAESDRRRWRARRELIAEGEEQKDQLAVLSGWACHQRILADGRRQILGFLCPGDLIGGCQNGDAVSATSVMALTEVVTCVVPAYEPGAALAEACARDAALERHHFLAHITRLGRLNAYERLADWLLEMQDRLALAGLCFGEQFPLPLTQELLADALGLTSVHINRTLQTMRRDGALRLQGGVAKLQGREALANLVGYKPPRIGAAA